MEKYAYVAGIIDGEGCFRIHHRLRNLKNGNKIYYEPSIQVTNTNIELIKWLETNFKGSRTQKIVDKNGKWKSWYIWHIYGIDKMIDFLQNILPHLVIKRRHVELLLEFCKSRIQNHANYTTRDIEIANIFKTINRKGLSQ